MVTLTDVLPAFMAVYGIRQQSRQSMPCIGRSLRQLHGKTDSHGTDTNNKFPNKEPFIIRELIKLC
ncbi:hypothetical protein [Nostoc sp. 'Peltigera membranacea cyanobiont' 232]|uniref:hypothetical protein n=1 Tax=Nostoc sp. 'Peltigera membranacea cyanobiont' 232 TaxID=2014531 RepID=UPI00118026DA|nr:hypothetical protein [Nostoc sp. 'Peltigera membranacea cyanobiont' 232]